MLSYFADSCVPKVHDEVHQRSSLGVLVTCPMCAGTGSSHFAKRIASL